MLWKFIRSGGVREAQEDVSKYGTTPWEEKQTECGTRQREREKKKNGQNDEIRFVDVTISGQGANNQYKQIRTR